MRIKRMGHHSFHWQLFNLAGRILAEGFERSRKAAYTAASDAGGVQ